MRFAGFSSAFVTLLQYIWVLPVYLKMKFSDIYTSFDLDFFIFFQRRQLKQVFLGGWVIVDPIQKN
jgi:riboflavin transporter FmnP